MPTASSLRNNHEEQNSNDPIEIRVARSHDEFSKIIAIRAIVYMSEQECPYDEEFDGNDFGATQLLALYEGEPAATLRIRFFADFAKPERLAVRPQFRQQQVGERIMDYGLEFCARKGYKIAIGQGQVRLMNFLNSRFGATIYGEKHNFSDHEYFPVKFELSSEKQPLTMDTDPMVLIRPEGDWDRAGILETSAARAPTNPHK